MDIQKRLLRYKMFYLTLTPEGIPENSPKNYFAAPITMGPKERKISICGIDLEQFVLDPDPKAKIQLGRLPNQRVRTNKKLDLAAPSRTVEIPDIECVREHTLHYLAAKGMKVGDKEGQFKGNLWAYHMLFAGLGFNHLDEPHCSIEYDLNQ